MLLATLKSGLYFKNIQQTPNQLSKYCSYVYFTLDLSSKVQQQITVQSEKPNKT